MFYVILYNLNISHKENGKVGFDRAIQTFLERSSLTALRELLQIASPSPVITSHTALLSMDHLGSLSAAPHSQLNDVPAPMPWQLPAPPPTPSPP